MATLEGARALGWEHLTGSLEPGKSADVIAVRLPAGGPPPDGLSSPPGTAEGMPDIVSALVGRGQAGEVTMTMVAGRVAFESGRPPAGDLSGYRTAREKLGLKG